MIPGEGGYRGPDLTSLGVTVNLARIGEALLDPNKRLAKGFDPVTVTLADGTRVEGVAKNYPNNTLQILDREGGLHFLANDGASAIEFLEDSWMPADYWDRLSGDEIEDMLAFLIRLSLSSDEIPSAGAPRSTALHGSFSQSGSSLCPRLPRCNTSTVSRHPARTG